MIDPKRLRPLRKTYSPSLRPWLNHPQNGNRSHRRMMVIKEQVNLKDNKQKI
jgi:hypothetical protein